MDLNLQGKVAIVTGAGSQIGFCKGIALVLAREGCNLVVADVDYEGVKKTAATIEGVGRKALAVKTNVTKMAEVKEMVSAAIQKFGKVDILVNGAGAGHPTQPFANVPEEMWNAVLDLNLRGVMNCTQTVLPHMIAQKWGKIVNVASGAGYSGMPNCVAYGSAKSAVIAFTRGLSKEVLAQGINVNAIAPGIGNTGFLRSVNMPAGGFENVVKNLPSQRATTPEDLGNLVAYLSSDVSVQIVGQTILIDGGQMR